MNKLERSMVYMYILVKLYTACYLLSRIHYLFISIYIYIYIYLFIYLIISLTSIFDIGSIQP